MDITHGTPDGAPQSLINGDWVLFRDNATGRFARRFSFALPTGGLADGFRCLSSTGFTLSLPAFDYNARASDAPESVSVANSGDGVLLTFPSARTLLRVKIASADAADIVEARRIDGDVITDDPFASAAHGTSGATLTATDRTIVLRQKRAGTPIVVRAAGVVEAVVRSSPANVRVGVSIPAVGSDVFYLGPDAGPVLTSPGTPSNLGPALGVLLQGITDRLTDALEGALLPALVPMMLVVEADVPARAHIASFVLRYRLSRRRFNDQASKRVLELGGSSPDRQQFTIDVPRGATLWSATLRMMGPFKEQADGDSGGGDDGDEPAIPQPVPSDTGVALGAGESVAAKVVLQRAALVQGATVDLAALADGSSGRVRLHKDESGKPGEPLGEGGLPPAVAGARRVFRVEFDRPAVVSAGPIWVAVQCDNGALVWLTPEPGEATAGATVLRRAAGDVAWSAVTAASDRGALVSLVTAAATDDSIGSADHPAFHGVRLHLGGVRLRGSSPQAGAAGAKETHFNVTSVVAPLVQSASIGSLVPVSMSLVSGESARVTVYPPEVEFDP